MTSNNNYSSKHKNLSEISLEEATVIPEEKMGPLYRWMGAITNEEFRKLSQRRKRENEALSNTYIQKLKKIPWLENAPSIKDTLGEYILAENFSPAQLYFFRNSFGDGKGSLGLSFLEENDLYMTGTTVQVKDDRKSYEKIHDRDTIQIIGFRHLLGLKKDGVPEDVKNLWMKEKQVVEQLRKIWNKDPDANKPRDITAKWKTQNPNTDSELIKRWKKQFREETWKENVVFCTTERLEMVMKRGFMPDMNLIIVDEGVEKNPTTEEWAGLDKQLARIGVQHTNNRNIEGEPETQLVQFHPYTPEIDSLEKTEFSELQAVTRKLLIQYWNKVEDFPDQRGIGLAQPIAYVCDKELVEDFKEKWTDIAKKEYGASKIVRERYKLKEQGKLDKLIRLGQIQDVMETIWFSLYVRTNFYRQEGEVTQLKTAKPKMYTLWDLARKTDTEIWILDATLNKYNIDHQWEKYAHYSDDPLEQVNWSYLGEADTYGDKTEIELEDRTIDSLEAQKIETVDYLNLKLDWNVEEGIKDTVPKTTAGKNDLIQLQILTIKKEAEEKGEHHGVVSYKEEVVEKFENCENVTAKTIKQSTGTNQLKDCDEIHSIGKRPIQGLLEDYINIYREIPSYLPDEEDNSRMRKKGEKGGLIGYRDRLEAPKKRIIEDIDTHWEECYRTVVELPTFDSYFRLRPDYVDDSQANITGRNARNFANKVMKLSDWVKERWSNKEIVKYWNEIPCKSVFSDREIISTSGRQATLKKKFRKWKDFQEKCGIDDSIPERCKKLNIGQRTYKRYRKQWKKLGLSTEPRT